MLFFDADQVHGACDYPELIAALKRYHLDDIDIVGDQMLSQPATEGGDNILFLRSAWQRGQALGTKVITGFWNNPSHRDLPAVHAIYCLFSGEDGHPLAVLDGTALTLRKTAADSALGASYLARNDVETMLMIGAGAMAPHLIMAHKAIRPSLKHVAVWNRSPDKPKSMINDLEGQNAMAGLTFEVVTDLKTAAGRADLISSATRTVEPIIEGAWLKPGTHLDLIGAYKKDMREADDAAIQQASIFVDSRTSTIDDVGEIAIPIERGVISEADILADHQQLARGEHPGRRNDNEITLFKNGGGGHLDLMTARFVAER